MRRRWTVLIRPTTAQLLRRLRDRCPKVIVFQVSLSPGLDQFLDTSLMLRDRWPQLSLIAIDTSRDERVEMAVRMAGASVYLHLDETEQFEEALRWHVPSALVADD